MSITTQKNSRIWHWVIIIMVNIIIILNYFDLTKSLYLLYHIMGFELLLRCLFSDLIVYSQRKYNKYPIVWWLLAFLFSPFVLAYLYCIPFVKNISKRAQSKLSSSNIWNSDGISNRLALALTIMLLLAHSTRDTTDYAGNILEAARIITLVARENPEPHKIGEIIGPIETQGLGAAPDGGYSYIFQKPGSKIKYYFFINDKKITMMNSLELIYIPRGVTYETLERLYVKQLTKYFGYPPKVENVPSIRHEIRRKSFTWKNVELYIRYEDRSSVRKSISNLWKKNDEIGVCINYQLDENN